MRLHKLPFVKKKLKISSFSYCIDNVYSYVDNVLRRLIKIIFMQVFKMILPETLGLFSKHE